MSEWPRRRPVDEQGALIGGEVSQPFDLGQELFFAGVLPEPVAGRWQLEQQKLSPLKRSRLSHRINVCLNAFVIDAGRVVGDMVK